MGPYAELLRFVEQHHRCGQDTVRISAPSGLTGEGYRLQVNCRCGGKIDRWVTPREARHDLIFTNLLASRN